MPLCADRSGCRRDRRDVARAAFCSRLEATGIMRELLNAVERAPALSVNDILTLDAFVRTDRKSPDSIVEIALEEKLSFEELERAYICRLLKKTDGHKTNALKILGLDVA